MKDFILASLPLGGAALFLVVLIIKKNISKNKEKKAEDYSAEGMSIGMCLGCAIGASNIMNIGISLSLGMLFGFAIGMMIKKENLGRKIVDKKREDFVYSTFGDYSFLDGHHLFL